MRIINLVLSATIPLCILANAFASETEEVPASKQQANEFIGTIVKEVKLKYLLYLPEGYDLDHHQKIPLILFLHGAGERGNDLEKVKVHGIPKIVEQKEDFPFIAVSPQCPQNSWWTGELEALNALLDDVISQYPVDENRIYLTGLSMGGYGAWALAMKYPKRFAAVVPICGGGNPDEVSAIKDIPVWVFHGAKDNVVPIEQSEKMVEALKNAGGNVQFTVYPEAGHDSWTETYDNPELYEWFMKQSRAEK